MPTSKNKQSQQTTADTSHDSIPPQTSERAKAIARRTFLRRSAGVAAPVVMTLQSGPALALTSVTCFDKTEIDDAIFNLPWHARSGFTLSGTHNLAAGNTYDFSTLNTGQTPQDPDVLDNIVGGGSTKYVNRLNLSISMGKNDGFTRCTNTPVVKTTGGMASQTFEYTSFNTWEFKGPILMETGLGANPGNDTGAIAFFTVDVDPMTQNQTAIFQGCFGRQDPIDSNARPLTSSCWSSLQP